MVYNVSEQRLVIPENGFYVIYLQVSYRNITACEDAVVHLSQYVTRQKRGYPLSPKPIITNRETVVCKETVWFKTISNNARLFLHQGDRLQVELGPESEGLISKSGQPWTKTFWGVYLDGGVN